jgi:hypothetical protein
MKDGFYWYIPSSKYEHVRHADSEVTVMEKTIVQVTDYLDFGDGSLTVRFVGLLQSFPVSKFNGQFIGPLEAPIKSNACFDQAYSIGLDNLNKTIGI